MKTIPPVCGTSTTTSKTPRQDRDLEKSAEEAKGNTNTYSAMVKKLKADLEEKNKEYPPFKPASKS